MPLIPGQGTQVFVCMHKKPGKTESGRPTAGYYEPDGSISGMMTNATPKEEVLWAQNNHPITHKIVQPIPTEVAEPGDYFVISDGESKRFLYIQGIENPGDLFHFVVYYVQERKGLDA